jgi:hypothetical protein
MMLYSAYERELEPDCYKLFLPKEESQGGKEE